MNFNSDIFILILVIRRLKNINSCNTKVKQKQ